ncbi:MAG: ABC transporter permease [Oligoflexus sp.]
MTLLRTFIQWRLWKMIDELWSHKRLCLDLIKRDIKFKFLGSLIGKYWNIIHPLAMITVYTVVFSKIMGAKIGGLAKESPLSYTIYLCAGLLPWNAFVETISRGTNVYFDHAHLIKKVSFPSSIIHFVSAGSSTFTFAISMSIYFLLLLFSGYGLNGQAILVIPIFLIQLVFSIGLGLFLSVLQVFFRDTAQIVSIVLQLWFWGTPIVYMESRVPESLHWLLTINPMYHFVSLYHKVLVYNVQTTAQDWFAVIGLAAIAAALGTSFLGFFEKEIPDEI